MLGLFGQGIDVPNQTPDLEMDIEENKKEKTPSTTGKLSPFSLSLSYKHFR